MSEYRDQIVVFAVATLVLFTNLGKPRLWDRDEPRNAGCAREMMDRGDWVVPVFNAELRTHKPVLLYWFTMAAYAVLGVSEFSARLPSAVLSMGTVALTYVIARRLLGRRVAVWSCCILATFVMFSLVGRAATPDATLVFFGTAALAVFVNATWSGEELGEAGRALGNVPFPGSAKVAAAMYGFMGVAVLAKGPVGLVLPTAVIGMFCLIVRYRTLPQAKVPDRFGGSSDSPAFASVFLHGWGRLRDLLRLFYPRHFFATCWSMRPALAIAVVLLVAGPWYAWVGIRTDGEWLRGFFGEHNFGRAVTSMEGHGGSILYYPVTLLACCFPWSVFAIPTWLSTRQGIQSKGTNRDAFIFLSCWVGVYVVLFSIARTKLPSYVAPTYPAIAILVGVFVERVAAFADPLARRWWRIGLWTLIAVGALMAVAVTLVTRKLLPAESSIGLIGFIPVTGAILCLLLIERDRFAWSAQSMTATATVFAVVLMGVAAVRISHHQDYDRLMRYEVSGGGPELGALGGLEPSWVYYSGTSIREFSPQEIGPAAEFLQSCSGNRLVVTSALYGKLRDAMRSRIQILGRTDYFLRDEQLLLVSFGESELANVPGQSVER